MKRKKSKLVKSEEYLVKRNKQKFFSLFTFHSSLSKKGSVLITVVWTLSLLAIFVTAITRRVSQELFAGKWIKESVISRSLAKAGIERALLEIQSDEFITFDALNEPWASNEVGFKDVEIGGGFFTVSCNASEDEESDEGVAFESKVRYGACDESARININTADEVTLMNLFMTVRDTEDTKEAIDLAHAIMDWRDEDDAEMLQGAERNYYKALAKPYEPRNDDFQSVEELQMVKGMTRELYDLIKDHVTVYTEGPVNFNTATETTLKALGLTHSAAMGVITYRLGEDGVEGTEDDGVFQATEAITSAMSAGTSLTAEDYALISNIVSEKKATVKSDSFRIRAIGRFISNSGNPTGLGVICVLKRDGSVLYWWEGNI